MNHYYQMSHAKVCKHCGELIDFDEKEPDFWYHDTHGASLCRDDLTSAEPYSSVDTVTITIAREAAHEMALHWAESDQASSAKRQIALECLHALGRPHD